MGAKEDFFDALYEGDTKSARELMDKFKLDANIDNGVAASAGTFKGVPALHFVIKSGDVAFARELIERGANVNAQSDGLTALHVAPSAECVQMLLERGANVNARLTKDVAPFLKGATPLHFAAHHNRTEATAALLQAAGVKVNLKDSAHATPLHLAAAGKEQIARALIQAGANLRAKAKDGTLAQDVLRKHFPDFQLDGTARADVRDAAATELAATENSIARAEVPAAGKARDGAEEEPAAKKKRPVPTQGEENVIARAPASGQQGDLVDAISRAPADAKEEEKEAKQEAAVDQKPSLAPGSVLNGRFVRDEQGQYRRVGEKRVALVDEGERIRFVDKQMDAFQAGVMLAKIKEWEAIQVSGTEQFRSEAWFHARMEGLQVIGYEPNEKDLQRLETAQARAVEASDKTRAAEGPSSALETSKKEAEDYALQKVGGIHKLNTGRDRCAGKIVHETDHHFVQSLGRGVAAVHDKSLFPQQELQESLKLGQTLRVQYSGGKATIEAGRDKSIGIGVGR